MSLLKIYMKTTFINTLLQTLMLTIGINIVGF